MPRKSAEKKTTKESVRLFPCWASTKKENWLSKKAASGWLFTDSGCGAIYRFVKSEERKLLFAVEYMGKNPDVPLEIANDCNSGWEYVGRFGKYRYYYREEGENGPDHPVFDNPYEPSFLRSVMTNLITLMLLNIPGTLYCIIYLLFFFGDGFGITSLLTETGDGVIYLIGAVLGAVSYLFLFRSLSLATRRLNYITRKNTLVK